jgi:nucleoside-diphosphate-sugar epimerase
VRVLVTGAAGYLGSVLCEHLLAAGHRVVALDAVHHGVPSLLHLAGRADFEFVRGDARDEATLHTLVASADAIVPLAAVVGAPACDRDPWLATSTNLDAIHTLLALRSPAQLVVYPTTNSGYGTRSGDVFCTEDTPLQPISLYGRTKVDAEAAVLAAPNTSLANGPRMVGRAYNAGLDAANVSKEELALLVQKHVPRFHVVFSEIGSDPDKRNYVVSNQRLREAGFEANRSLDDGMAELLRAYRMLPLGSFRNA